MNQTRIALTILLLAGLAMSATADPACRVYWTEWYSYNPDLSRIARVGVDGGGVESILTGFQDGVGAKDLVIDSEAGKIYIANRSAGLIERANLDGSDRETVLSDLNPIGLALDPDGGRIYWADYTYNDPTIRRADLDGTGMQILASASDGCVLEGIVLDTAAGHLYWAERMDQQIWRANLDGTGAFMFLQCWEGVGHPCGLALGGDRIYWSSGDAIFSANLSADDIRPLVEELSDSPRSLEMDMESGKLYWVTNSSWDGMVQRINLDGSGLETVVDGLRYGYGIALEFGPAVGAPDVLPAVLNLANHPNPFNPRTTITYDLPAPATVRLRIHDLAGRLVWESAMETVQPGGRHELVWNGADLDGRGLPSGTYLMRLEAGAFRATRRVALVR